MISILVAVLVLCVLWWALTSLAAAFGLPAQIVVVLQIILVILALIWILGVFGVGPGIGLQLK